MSRGDPTSNLGLLQETESLREQLAKERDATVRLLRLASSSNDLHSLMREATLLLCEWSGCDAVGIRLRDGDDFPYFETRGFPREFIQAENTLCARDVDGQLLRDRQGNAVLECMCGNILCGRFDPTLPFFTPGGSFWTNSTTELLANTTEADRQSRTRNRCNTAGYESVSLIPLQSGGTTLGLLQLNDRRVGRFTPDLIASIEGLAAALGEAIARRRTAETLRRSQAELRAIYDSAPVMMCALDSQRCVLYLNRTMAEFVGKTEDELRQQRACGILGCVNALDDPRGCGYGPNCESCALRLAMLDTLETGQSHRGIERRMTLTRGRDRQEVVLLGSTAAIQVGGHANLLLCLEDVTEHRRARKALTDSEVRYRRLFEAAKDGILILDAETGMILDVNPFLLELLGYSHEQFLGKRIWELGFFKDVAASQANFAQLQRQEYIRYEDLPLETADGRQINVEFVGNVYSVDHQRVIQCNIRDITDRKRAMEEVRQAREFSDHVISHAGEGIVVYDRHLRYVAWNRFMENLTGVSAEEVLGKHCFDLFPHLREQGIDRLLERALAGEVVASGDVPYGVPGTARSGWVTATYGPQRDADGNVTGAIAIVHDITNRKANESRLAAMQLQLNHASRLAILGELAAGIAHEVNQPLCAIVNFTKACKNLASSESADLGQIRDWSDAAAGAAAQAGDIVRRLLGFARRSQPDREVVGVRSLVDNATLLVRHEAQFKRVSIRLDMAEPELSVEVRAVPIQQVMVNLLRNSIEALGEASPLNRQVVVCARRQEDGIEISVSDNGPGLPEAERARIFEPFFTTKPQGVGLGLPISRTIVEDHGGTIWATANLDGGLEIHFTLPARKE